MTFEDAIVQVLRAYWEDEDSEMGNIQSKPKKYTKEYFNGFSKSKEPEEVIEDKKRK